jgi:hypothetical protein
LPIREWVDLVANSRSKSSKKGIQRGKESDSVAKRLGSMATNNAGLPDNLVSCCAVQGSYSKDGAAPSGDLYVPPQYLLLVWGGSIGTGGFVGTDGGSSGNGGGGGGGLELLDALETLESSPSSSK